MGPNAFYRVVHSDAAEPKRETTSPTKEEAASTTIADRWNGVKERLAPIRAFPAAVVLWVSARWRIIAFNLAVLPVLGLIYFNVNSIGLRLTIPALALKLHRVGLPSLRHYHWWRDLDLANVAALGMLILVWVFALFLMRLLLLGRCHVQGVNEPLTRAFVLTAGSVLLIADAVMFYHGIGEQAGLFGGGKASWTQIVLTVAYSTALLAVAFLHVLLEQRSHQ